MNCGSLTEWTVGVVLVGMGMETLTPLNNLDLNIDMLCMNVYEW